MSAIALDFYEPDGTTLLGTLDDADLLDLELRPALMELGAIKFTISRHDASAALLAKRNLIKVRIPSVDADPIALFVLKDDEAELVSKDEEGGEHLQIKGPGGLHMLSYGRLDEVFYAPGQTRRGNQEIPGEWAWHDVAYGGILTRILEEAVYSPGGPCAAISLDFDRDVDSVGNPWYVIAEDFSVLTGTDVLTCATRLAEAGDLIMVLTPDMILHCYQSVDDFARDLTGAFAADNVRIQKGVNLLTELNRKAKMDRVTHLITRDMDQVFRTFVTPDAYSQAVYGFLDISWTNDPDQVEKTADEALRASDDFQEEFRVELTPGFAPADGLYMPGPTGTDGHFWLGDEITLHTGSGQHDLNAADVRVASLAIVLDEAADDASDDKAARSLRIVPELTFGLPPPSFSNVGTGTTKGTPNPPVIRLCQPTTASLPVVESGSWISTTPGACFVPAGLTDSILIAFAQGGPGPGVPGGPPFTATYGGVPLERITGSATSDPPANTEAFYFLNPAADPGAAGAQLSVVDAGANGNYKGYVVLSRVNQSNPIAGMAAASGTGTAAAPGTIPSGSGVMPIAAMFGVGSPAGAGDPTPDPGQASAWATSAATGVIPSGHLETAGGSGSFTPSWTLSQVKDWVALGIGVNGVAGTSGDGHPDLIGTSIRVKRCDDTEHYHTDADPTTSDNRTMGFRPNTLWINEDTGDMFLLIDADAGTWISVGGGLSITEIQDMIDASITVHLSVSSHPEDASDLTTRYEPHVDYDGHVIVNGSGDPVMVEVAN